MSWLSTRLSTYQQNYFLRNSVSQATMELQKAGQELSTGRRADIFGDLGPRAGVAITMRAREENTQAYLTSNGVLENKLSAMLTSMEAIRAPVQEVLQTAILNKENASTGSESLQAQARAALETVLGTLNISFNGEHLFAGTTSNVQPMMRWDGVNPDTGYSPEDVFANIVGTGPTSAADAATMIAELDQVFTSSHTGTPDFNYESTFYRGTPELDGSGNPSERISARLDIGQALHYGVQANDDGIRDIIKGLGMLAIVDLDTMTDVDGYRDWMEEVVSTLADGVQSTLDDTATIGFNQQIVDKAKTRLSDISIVQVTQIATYENVDTYAVATRMSALETQLQASYSVSGRLSGLSILNWL